MTRSTTSCRFATAADAELVSSILTESASWIAEQGAPLWPLEQLTAEAVAEDVRTGNFVLAQAAQEAVATARLTKEDPAYWPEAAPGEAAYVHRIAVRRAWSGKGVPEELLAWCSSQAKVWGREYLRLDCDAGRPRLRNVYESLGFRFHSEHPMPHRRVARYERRVV